MTCICCGSEQIKDKFKKKSYQLRECGSCGFQFVHPLPSNQEIETHYDSTRISEDLKEKIKRSLDDLQNSSNSPKRDWFKRIVSTAQQHLGKEQLNILEIGSAYGFFIDYCNNSGHKAVGTEVTEKFASATKGLINGEVLYIENGDYNKYFEGRKFDFIYLEHVFEHVLYPAEILKKIENLLTDDGIVILVVPNHKSLLARLSGKYYKWTNPPDHLYFHNVDSLKGIAARCGFKPEAYWADDYYHRSIYQFYSLDVVKFKFYSLLKKLFKVEIKANHSYKYPRDVGSFFTLLPYLIVSPVIKFFNKRYTMGNELAIVLKKDKK